MPFFQRNDEEDRPTRAMVDLRWNETSGVDSAANDEPWWAVMKQSASPTSVEQMLEAAQTEVEREESLFTSLRSLDVSQAPEPVQKSAVTLLAWLAGEGYGEAEPAQQPRQQSGKISSIFRRVVHKHAEPDDEVVEGYDHDELDTLVEQLLGDGFPTFREETLAALDKGTVDERAVSAMQALDNYEKNVTGQLEMLKRDFSDSQRQKLADQGKALPGGAFPIETVGDLHDAIQSIGRARNPALAKNHICKRAKSLGRMDLIPDDWPCKKG